MSRAVMQQALEALECLYNDTEIMVTLNQHRVMKGAITALRAALAEPQTTHWEGCEAVHPECRTTPRKPLTDEEIEVAAKSVPAAVYELMYGHEITVEKFRAALAEFARAIERAHGIGEQDEP